MLRIRYLFNLVAPSYLALQSPEIQTTDVLDHHQQRNGCPHPPDPATLASLQDQSVDADINDSNRPHEHHVPRNSRRVRSQPAPPNLIAHYPPRWKDCLEEAKIECWAVHALSNPWPKMKIDADSLADSLTTVVVQWTQRAGLDPGK